MTYSPQSPVSDSSRPHTGALITAKEISDLINSATAFNSKANAAPKIGESVLLADVGFVASSIPASPSSINFTVISPDQSTSAVSANVNASPVSAADVVTDIASAFQQSGVSQYVEVSSISDDPTGRLRLVIAMTGGRTLRIDSATNGIDDIILGVAQRNATGTLPYTVPQADPVHGTPFLSSTSGVSTLYVDTPARIVGVPLTSTVTGNLRIRLKVANSESKLDIAISDLSATQIADQINSDFNPFFTGLTGDVFDTYEVASVSDNRVVLKLDNLYGDGEGTYFNAATEIGISPPDVNGRRINDDLALVIFGLEPRRGYPEYVYTNSRKVSFLRGVPVSSSAIEYSGSRNTIGLGYIGSAFGSKSDIGVSSEDFEIRYDAHSAIPWAHDGATGKWSRAVPAVSGALSYDKTSESYALLTTDDTYTPDYLGSANTAIKTGSSAWLNQGLASTVFNAGVVGDLPRLIDIRSSRSVSWYGANITDSRNSHRPLPLFTDASKRLFQRATHQGIPYLGDVSVLEGIGNGIGATSEAMVVAAAVGNVIPTYTAFSGGFLDLDLEGTFEIPANRIIRVVTSYSNRAVDREAIDLDWSAQVAQFQTQASHNTVSGGILYSNGALSSGWDSAEIVTSSQFGADDYGIEIDYGASFPSGENPILVAVSPDPEGLPDVAATFSTQDTPADSTTRVGVILSSDYSGLTSSPNAWDPTSTGVASIVVTVDAGGVGGVWLVNGSGFSVIWTSLDSFAIDIPLDEVPRTLRAAVRIDPENDNPIVEVYWGGTADYSASTADERNVSTNETFARGGVEGDHRTPTLVHSVTADRTNAIGQLFLGSNVNDPTYLGALPGLYVDPKGGDAIVIDNFVSVGFSSIQTEPQVPGLPPVSGALIRDTISALTVSFNGVRQGIGEGNHAYLVTDCNHTNPLNINLTGDLALTLANLAWPNGVPNLSTEYEGDPGRTINIGFELNELSSFKEPRYWPVEGSFGYGNVSPINPADDNTGLLPSTTLSPALTSNSKSSKTTWDLGDYVLTEGIGYNGFAWVATGAPVPPLAVQKYTILQAGGRTNILNASAMKSSNTFRLGNACDMATLESGATAFPDNTPASDRYTIIKSYNRLTVPPSGYWAPFGDGETTYADNGYENGVGQSSTLTMTRIAPQSLRMTDAYEVSPGSYAGGFNFPNLNPNAGSATADLVRNDGWWASVPVVNDNSDNGISFSNADDFMVTRNRHGAQSITDTADTLYGRTYLHTAADRQRIYCTPAWTPARTRIVYAFLSTMPSILRHQAAYNNGTSLRYEVECAEVDYVMSSWLGNSHNVYGMTSFGERLDYSFSNPGVWSPTGTLPAGIQFRNNVDGIGGNNGTLGASVASEFERSSGTQTAIVRRASPYGSTRFTTRTNGYYDLWSSVYPFTDRDPTTTDDHSFITWHTGKQIEVPRITEVTFAQPGTEGSIVKVDSPFVTVLVSIEYHGPVVPSGIRLKTSAISTPV